MDEIHEKYILGNGALAPVVFIHGDFQNYSVFKKIADMIRKKGHTILSFDLPGHGLSKISEKDSDLILFLKNFLSDKELKNPVIIGHSFGGMLTIKYAIDTGNISALVLLNTPFDNLRTISPKIDWEKQAELCKKLSKEKFQKQELIDYTALNDLTEDNIRMIGLERTNLEAIINHFNFQKQFSEDENFYNLNIPVLFIASEDDFVVPIAYAKEYIPKMKNAKLVIVKGGHNALITNPLEVLKAIEENYLFFCGRKTL